MNITSKKSNSENGPYKERKTFEERKQEALLILNKYPDRLPIICERAKRASSSVPELDKHKFLVPKDLTIGQFIHVIRKRIKLESISSIFIFCNNNTLPPTSSLILSIYNEYKDEDGFLYLQYNGEDTFGYF